MAMKCERCTGEHDHSTEFCCSSHSKRLCHDCYKRTHFVQGVCCHICRVKVALGARRDA